MLVLLSNDDGVHAKGLKDLASSLKKIKNIHVVVVAPDRERSASSHALTIHRPLRIVKKSKDVYSVDGTPTDSVMLGVHAVLKRKPDLIVSGINKGANLGEDVHYSGTVSAAMEGAIMGVPSIAVSLVGETKFNYGPAAVFTQKLVKQVLKEGLPAGMVLNVNVPPLPLSQIRGVAITSQGKHNYGDILVEKIDPRGRPYFWIGGNPRQFEDRVGSDTEAFLKNQISITPLKVDMTDFSFMKKLKKWHL